MLKVKRNCQQRFLYCYISKAKMTSVCRPYIVYFFIAVWDSLAQKLNGGKLRFYIPHCFKYGPKSVELSLPAVHPSQHATQHLVAMLADHRSLLPISSLTQTLPAVLLSHITKKHNFFLRLLSSPGLSLPSSILLGSL